MGRRLYSLSGFFKQCFVDFWQEKYPGMLVADGFKDKTVGMMVRQGAREDAKAYIRKKKKENQS